MIINLRGTHGSGKTTIVRKVMEEFPKRKPVYIDTGRKIPIGYICKKKDRNPLFIPGSYEYEVSGGCDNIPKVDMIYGQVRRYAKKGYDVLYEGIVAQHSTPNIIKLNDEYPGQMRVILLDLPVKKSLKGVKSRRKKRGETKQFNPANTIKEARDILSSSKRLRIAGVKVKFAKNRTIALERIFELLEL